MKHTVWLLMLLLLCSPVLSNVNWDWIVVSPSYLEFDKPECKVITIRPMYGLNYTEVELQIFSREYPNGVSTGYIFKVYGDFLKIHKSEVREVLVCAEYDEDSVPRGEYEATLAVESGERVYNIPLILDVSFGNRFWQKSKFEIKRMWLQQLFTIPTPDGSFLAFRGYHFIFFLIFIIIIIWMIYLIYYKKKYRKYKTY